MAVPETLQRIYDRYDEKMAEEYGKATIFSGAFGMGDDPRKSACNEIFFESLRDWCAEYAASGPEAEAVCQVVGYILNAAARRSQTPTYWFTYAAQQHCVCLIPMLRTQDAATILAEFQTLYPRLDRTPVQEEVIRLLNKAAGNAPQQEDRKSAYVTLWCKRVVLLLIGLAIAHLGVTLFLLADLGSDPFNVMIQGLFRGVPWGTLPVTHGTVHVAVSLLIIVALLVIDRTYVRIGTFLCMILGGPIIDLFTVVLGGMVSSSSAMAVRILAVVLGCGILAFGMTIVIKSQAGTGPNDLVAVVISDKGRWKFGIVRIAVDIGFAALGFVLGGTVGVGTLICLAVVGPVAQIFMPFSERICGRLLGTDSAD